MSGTLLIFGWQHETDVQMCSACSIYRLKGRLIQLHDPLLALHGNNLCCYCIAYFRWLARLILSTLSLVSPKLHSQASFYGRSNVLHLFEGDIKGRTFEIK